MKKTEKVKPKTVKTTIAVEENLWKKFSIISIQKFGRRKKKGIIVQLIKEYVEKNKK